MNRMCLCLLGAVLAIAASAGSTQAALVSVDFIWPNQVPVSGDTTTGPGPAQNAAGQSFTGQTGPWNAFNIDPSGYGNYTYPGVGPSAPFNDGQGNPTPVTFAITSSYRNGVSSWPPDSGLLREEMAYLYPQAGLSGETLTWELAGLDPTLTYALTVFGTGGGSNYLANGVPGLLDAEGDADWAAVVPAADGKILGSMYYNNSTPGIYGFQLLSPEPETVIPEPATMALLTLGVAGVGGYVRRRRQA